MHALELASATVVVRNDRLVVRVSGDDARRADDVRAVLVRDGNLALQPIDDDSLWFDEVMDEPGPSAKATELGVTFDFDGAVPGVDTQGVPVERVLSYAAVSYRVGGAEPIDDASQQAKARLAAWVATLTPPPGRALLLGRLDAASDGTAGWRTYLVDEASFNRLGDHVERALLVWDTFTRPADPQVRLEFSALGSQLLEWVTTQNVQRRVAFVIDGEVVFAPKVMTPIAGGSIRLMVGGVDQAAMVRSARRLAAVLAGGPLPARVELEQERPVQ